MGEVESGKGIKLFGTTIRVHGKERKEEKKESEEKRGDKMIACPRCKSMETKFCYFNNYNVNQPRHFCKGCQRYWTAGGALRNVPVGAGRRKAKSPTQQFAFDDCHVASLSLPHAHFQHLFPSKTRRINSELLVDAAEHESQKRFVIIQEITEHPN
ncbi:hypothetical protein VNO78_11348 [Psophocarpus tetragonolobus]|uniref:Dof-type domain-containing protein n=1 Tax=Psophocarpus tetragonolobus TaxID=3891 RepID=A0AAN9XN34_PSOTE